MFGDIRDAFRFSRHSFHCILVFSLREEVVKLDDERFKLGNELDCSFGDEDDSVVFTLGGAVADDVADFVCDVFDGFIIFSDLFTYNRIVGMCLKSTFKGILSQKPT